MNPAQLENIELRLAAVRGRPWVTRPCCSGAMHDGHEHRMMIAPRDVDHHIKRGETFQADVCAPCQRLMDGGAGFDRLCPNCQELARHAVRKQHAAFSAIHADADECHWLIKAPEDIEALIRSVRALSDERDALRRSFDAERQRAKDACDERSTAQQELAKLKASLATLKELLA